MSSDDQKRRLSIVERTLELSDFTPRNYWNTSGKNTEYFPTEPRMDSIPVFNKQGRVLQEPKDEWWINSKEHNYCFWSFIRSRSQPDGTMEPLLQSEIAELFGCSSTKVHFMLKEAMDKLMSDENMNILQNLMELVQAEPEDPNSAFGLMTNIAHSEEDDDRE
jgi:hypothetical protein